MDRVRPVKQESAATGGNPADDSELLQLPANPQEDALDVRGVYIQNDTSNDTTTVVSRDASDNMTFTDPLAGTYTLTQLASSSGVSISQATVNFGTFGYMATASIVDPTVLAGTRVMVSVGGVGGRDADELEFSPLSVAAIVTAGVGYEIIVTAPNGADGQFQINHFKG